MTSLQLLREVKYQTVRRFCDNGSSDSGPHHVIQPWFLYLEEESQPWIQDAQSESPGTMVVDTRSPSLASFNSSLCLSRSVEGQEVSSNRPTLLKQTTYVGEAQEPLEFDTRLCCAFMSPFSSLRTHERACSYDSRPRLSLLSQSLTLDADRSRGYRVSDNKKAFHSQHKRVSSSNLDGLRLGRRALAKDTKEEEANWRWDKLSRQSSQLFMSCASISPPSSELDGWSAYAGPTPQPEGLDHHHPCGCDWDSIASNHPQLDSDDKLDDLGELNDIRPEPSGSPQHRTSARRALLSWHDLDRMDYAVHCSHMIRRQNGSQEGSSRLNEYVRLMNQRSYPWLPQVQEDPALEFLSEDLTSDPRDDLDTPYLSRCGDMVLNHLDDDDDPICDPILSDMEDVNDRMDQQLKPFLIERHGPLSPLSESILETTPEICHLNHLSKTDDCWSMSPPEHITPSDAFAPKQTRDGATRSRFDDLERGASALNDRRNRYTASASPRQLRRSSQRCEEWTLRLKEFEQTRSWLTSNEHPWLPRVPPPQSPTLPKKGRRFTPKLL